MNAPLRKLRAAEQKVQQLLDREKANDAELARLNAEIDKQRVQQEAALDALVADTTGAADRRAKAVQSTLSELYGQCETAQLLGPRIEAAIQQARQDLVPLEEAAQAAEQAAREKGAERAIKDTRKLKEGLLAHYRAWSHAWNRSWEEFLETALELSDDEADEVIQEREPLISSSLLTDEVRSAAAHLARERREAQRDDEALARFETEFPDAFRREWHGLLERVKSRSGDGDAKRFFESNPQPQRLVALRVAKKFGRAYQVVLRRNGSHEAAVTRYLLGLVGPIEMELQA